MITRSPNPAASKAAPRVQLGGQPAAEYYQTLWARLQGPALGIEAPQTIGVTSCCSREGVSTVTANLAIVAAARPNQRVLLVEANFQRPVLADWLDANSTPGLSDLLAGRCTTQAALHYTNVADLILLPAGDQGTAAELDLSLLCSLLSDFKDSFDVILFDLPPAQATSLALPLAGLLDGVVLVIQAEGVSWETARRVRDLLAQSHASLLGVVLNKRPEHLPGWLRGQP